MTLWRAYDENGQPVNSSDHYFKFNPEGAQEGETVFVIGNPGSTERYRTTAQLEYDGYVRYPTQLTWMKNRYELMQKQYEENPSYALQSQIFSLGNGIKAIGGIVAGLQNETLFNRKKIMEDRIRAEVPTVNGADPWAELEKSYAELSQYGSSLTLLSPNPMNGAVVSYLHGLYDYYTQLKNGNSPDELKEQAEELKKGLVSMQSDKEKAMFEMVLNEISQHSHPQNRFIDQVLNGMSVSEFVEEAYDESCFLDDGGEDAGKMLKKKASKWEKMKDPLVRAALIMVPQIRTASTKFQSTGAQRKAWNEMVAQAIFQAKGTNLPPRCHISH